MASGQAKIDIEWGLAEIKKKAALYLLYSNYYKGLHRLTFATTEWRNEFGAIFSAFADNLCPAVIGAVRNRLSVIGFATMGGADDPAAAGVSRPLLRRGRVGGEDDAADAAWAIWNDNRMDRRQKSIYREALIAGDVSVIIWPDADEPRRPVFHVQKPDKCALRYSDDEPGEAEYAVKAWITPGKRVRVNVYYRDRVERWTSKGAGATGLPDKADRLIEYTGTEEEPEEFELENPAGDRVPVVSFGYDALEGEPGRSRLADVVPLQDALNKSVADMLVAGEFQAIPQRILIGWTPTEFDANGNPKPPWKSGADRILTVANENAKAAQFDAANLEAFIKEQDSFRAEIARVSMTPLHYLLLSGQFPSGDALEEAAAPLLAVVGDTQDGFGTSHEELMDLGLRIRTGAGARLSTLWKEVSASRNTKAFAETVQIRRDLGASRRQGLRELGYSDPEIDEMDEEEREEKLAADGRGEEPAPAPVPGASGLASVEARAMRETMIEAAAG